MQLLAKLKLLKFRKCETTLLRSECDPARCQAAQAKPQNVVERLRKAQKTKKLSQGRKTLK